MSPSSRIAVGWLPRQHGAWFLLTLPFVVGLLLRPRLEWFLLPLFCCWLAGYLAFNAASLWLKTAPARRSRVVRPLATYAGVALGSGLFALWLAGPALALWLPPFTLLLGAALWLAALRRERALLGGLLTVAAASLVTLVVRFPDPVELLRYWHQPPGTAALLAAGLVFGYQFGTVLYVKTMIRERGQAAWLVASVGWHVLGFGWTAALAATGGLDPAWPWFFAATIVRSVLLPALARRRPVRPLAVGLVEIGFSTAFLLVAAFG